MGQTFSLGRISGIRIGVNWSVVLIVGVGHGQAGLGLWSWASLVIGIDVALADFDVFQNLRLLFL